MASRRFKEKGSFGMTLEDFNCFMAVAENLSFSKAAQKLYVSQPAVTKRITTLEQAYHAKLFDRTNKRNVTLTEAGVILYDALSKSGQIYQDALRKIQRFSKDAPLISNLPSGIMLPENYVDIYDTFSIEILPTQLLMNFLDGADYGEHLDNGELLICEREALPDSNTYASQKLSDAPVSHCIFAGAGHPAVLENPNPKPEDFRDNPVFLNRRMPEALRAEYLHYLRKLYGHEPPEIVYLNSPEEVALLLRANRGITLNTEWLSIGGSAAVCTIPLPLTTDYYICWNPAKAVNAHIQKLLSILRI